MRYLIFSRRCALAVTLLTMCAGLLEEAAAQGRQANGNRSNANRGANAGQNTNRAANANQNVNRSANVNQNVNRNANVNQNVNVNRNVNVDVDNGWGGGYNNPLAAAAVVTAGVAVTAAAIGSIAYSVPPSCVPVSVNGATFQQCGSTWYQPQYAGTQVTYVVVNPPY
jgi:hypothetical protein